MHLIAGLITILGLGLFEVASSIDNAIINAEVLAGMGRKARRWFLSWGLFIAVVLVRGLLPWIIVWLSAPQLGPIGALTAAFSGDPKIHHLLEQAAPPLQLAGGVFLLLLFLHWLFVEPKEFGLRHERFFHAQASWFYTVASILLTMIVAGLIGHNSLGAFGALIGSTVFFITHGFRQAAETAEEELLNKSRSDFSKLVYLEVLDASFSFDGVLGAFAFTLSVPLILIGNGIGAIVIRQLTVANVDRIKRYIYLQNGAMYSILALSLVMLTEGYGRHLPFWLSPLATFIIIGYFWYRSHLRLDEHRSS